MDSKLPSSIKSTILTAGIAYENGKPYKHIFNDMLKDSSSDKEKSLLEKLIRMSDKAFDELIGVIINDSKV